jgi:hypothetical protein
MDTTDRLRALVDRELRRLNRKPNLTRHDRQLKGELAALGDELDDPSNLDELIDALEDLLEGLRDLREGADCG